MVSSLPVLLTLLPIALAAPAPAPIQVAAARHAMITPAPSLADRQAARIQRDIISDAKSGFSEATSDIAGFATYLSGAIGSFPSYVASGVPNFFQDFPTGSAVEKSLGISDGDLDAAPTQVLNVPGYANWTDKGWNLRFRGNVFKQPNISESKLNDLANIFLIDTKIEDLPAPTKTGTKPHRRNLRCPARRQECIFPYRTSELSRQRWRKGW